jgi:hypothetical protein
MKILSPFVVPSGKSHPTILFRIIIFLIIDKKKRKNDKNPKIVSVSFIFLLAAMLYFLVIPRYV